MGEIPIYKNKLKELQASDLELMVERNCSIKDESKKDGWYNLALGVGILGLAAFGIAYFGPSAVQQHNLDWDIRITQGLVKDTIEYNLVSKCLTNPDLNDFQRFVLLHIYADYKHINIPSWSFFI